MNAFRFLVVAVTAAVVAVTARADTNALRYNPRPAAPAIFSPSIEAAKAYEGLPPFTQDPTTPEPGKLAPSITYDFTARKMVFGATYDVGLSFVDLGGVRGLTISFKPLAGITSDGTGTLGGVVSGVLGNFSRGYALEVGLGARMGVGETAHGLVYLGLVLKT